MNGSIWIKTLLFTAFTWRFLHIFLGDKLTQKSLSLNALAYFLVHVKAPIRSYIHQISENIFNRRYDHKMTVAFIFEMSRLTNLLYS